MEKSPYMNERKSVELHAAAMQVHTVRQGGVLMVTQVDTSFDHSLHTSYLYLRQYTSGISVGQDT